MGSTSKLLEEDAQRSLMSLPRHVLRAQLRKTFPDLDEVGLDDAMRGIEILKERDPLTVLQEDSPVDEMEGGQLSMMKLAPNFEIAMYLAQATGACIVTDCLFRWNEIKRAIRAPQQGPTSALAGLSHAIAKASFRFPSQVQDILKLQMSGTFAAYPAVMREAFKYLASRGDRGQKPNFEAHLAARFAKVHTPAQNTLAKMGLDTNFGRITCTFPVGGIHDNTVNRLLLMSSSEHHLPSVPMAFFIDRPN